jgi:hypothetical protein
MRLLLLLLLLPFQATASVYTCPDGRGGRAHQQMPCEGGDEKFVRCIKPDGNSYMRKGTLCPERREVATPQAGMVTDVTTGQQHFMVPAGGNGMIDPRTGQRHELTGPPTQAVQDRAQPVSRSDACAEAAMKRDAAQSHPNRTVNTIRAAEERYRRMCGG